MTVQLNPELAKFVKAQVKAGQYRSVDEAVNAAVAKVQAEQDLLAGELNDEDLAAIENGLAQLNRGEGLPWEKVRDEIRARYLNK